MNIFELSGEKALGLFTGVTGIFYFIFVVVYVISLFKVYSKANVPGILAIIPFVNLYFMAKIAKVNPLIVLLLFIPYLNIFVSLYLSYKFTESFGLGLGGFFAYILLPPIAVLYMGFSDKVQYQYQS